MAHMGGVTVARLCREPTVGRIDGCDLSPQVGNNNGRPGVSLTPVVGALAEDSGTLLTGATGFLGGEVLARLVERDERPVYALIRAADDEQAAARLRGVLIALLGSSEPWSRRVVAVAGDIVQPGLGMAPERRVWLAERTRRIVHCAASVSFTLGLRESREINVEGTRRMLDLAELASRRGGLDYFSHVSTAYVAGDHKGEFGEDQLDVGQGFRNAYERSKFEAEMLVRSRGDTLPVQIMRPSIVVGDSGSGWTPAFNVLYTPLRSFAKGAYPALPARRGSPVDVVPVDYVAESLLALSGRAGTTYHLTAGERTTSVGELMDMASAYLDRPAPRVLSPFVYRRILHPLLVRTGSKSRRRALRRSEAFFPYFTMQVRYGNARARSALREHSIEPPPLDSYFDRLLGFALRAEWGKHPVARHEAAREQSPVPRRRRRRGSHARPVPEVVPARDV